MDELEVRSHGGGDEELVVEDRERNVELGQMRSFVQR